MRRRSIPLLLILSTFLAGCSRTTTMQFHPAAARPLPQVNRVCIISVDGLRPDLALRANMPRLRGLLSAGCFTYWARTTEVSITLPSHTSMLTGVTPEKHKVTWNTDLPPPQRYPAYPTLFEMAKRAGYTTAMVAGKTKFTALARPGTLDWSSIRATHDPQVAATAVEVIHAHQPQVLFIHFPDVDLAGHRFGWGSPRQIAAIERVDSCIGQVLDAIEEEGLTASTLIIVSADHGGAGLTHGANDARSRHIPWIAANPSIRQSYDLTRNSRLVVHTEDTFATACLFLGLPMAAGVDGKPITDLIPNRELLHSTR